MICEWSKSGRLSKRDGSCAVPPHQNNPRENAINSPFAFALGSSLGFFSLLMVAFTAFLAASPACAFAFSLFLAFSASNKLEADGSWGWSWSVWKKFRDGFFITWQNFSHSKKLKKKFCNFLMMSTISYYIKPSRCRHFVQQIFFSTIERSSPDLRRLFLFGGLWFFNLKKQQNSQVFFCSKKCKSTQTKKNGKK